MLSHISGTKQQKQISKQNVARDIEIKNKLTVNRGEGKRDNQGNQGKVHQGTCIKDTWTKPKGCRVKGGRWEWVGRKWWGKNGDNCT